MKKASLSKLEELHGKIANVLCELIEEEEEVMELQEIDGQLEQQSTGKMRKCVSPAMMAQAVNFVHKNGVVADLEGNKDMKRLNETLKAKQKHSRMGDGKIAAMEDYK